ncbi:MAG: hypothetical protein JSV91_10925 [Phycisphaerales bacterium]|nr:MAG: hypothetical protein JSV91_10925 [Phycisphaerales bacterium]
MNDLSPSGLARRESMRRQLTAAMNRIHRRRRQRRRLTAAAAGIAFIVLASLAVQLLPASIPLAERPDRRLAGDPSLRPSPDVSEPRGCVIRIVRTDPSVLDRVARPVQSTAVILDDEALLAMLAEIDRPAGLVRYGGKVHLTRPVTDVELTPPPPAADPSL